MARSRIRTRPAGRGPARLALVLAAVTATMAGQQTAFAEPGAPAAANPGARTAQPAAANAAPLTLAGQPSGPKVVTLVTGDQVRLTDVGGGHYSYQVTPGHRPDGTVPSFVAQAGPDGFFVLPSDAVPAIRSGRLDRALFDVKYLAEHGYADGQTAQVPVIVQYPTARTAASVGVAAQALPASTATRTLSSIHGAAVTVPKAQAAAFWSTVRGAPAGTGRAAPNAAASASLGAGLTKVWLDRKVHVDLSESVPLIGAPEAWAAGYDGTGVKVAILDTGIDDTHPDLAGKVVDSRSFVPDVTTVKDDHGHGTHVASTIAGSGAASGGKYRGVAPGASLVIGKVLDQNGNGDFSWIIAGMEWAATSGARVVSMSLGGDPTDGTDPVSQAVNDLTAQTGTLFVIAAGNAGPAEGTVGTPGAADAALTVAATSKTDDLASFSSRGPRAGDSALKPDIAAPGVNIVAARAAGTAVGSVVDEYYTSASGTSMATPHVAGAAAILAQEHADWNATQLKPALMSTSKDVGFTAYQRGAGRLDVARAVRQTVFAATANLDFGSVPDGQPPASKPLTYTNVGDQPVTLTLTPTLGTGDTSADGALTADQTVTVPAHGTATATVTVDSAALAQGQYTGAVVATDEAGDHLTTPVGMVREPPTATLTIRTLGRDGQPANPLLLDAVDVTGTRGRLTELSLVDTGVLKVRVPEGTISVSEWMSWVDEDSRPNNVQLLDPQVTVSGDTEITLDARTAVPVTFEVPDSEARPLNNDFVMSYQRDTTDGQRYWAAFSSLAQYGPTTRMWATPTETVTVGGLEFSLGLTMGRPEIHASVVRPRRTALDAVQPLNFLNPDGSWIENSIYPGFIPFTGTQELTVVDVGTGSPEEIAGRDLTGKLALMAAPDCFAAIEWMNAIRDAGAAAVATYGGENSGCRAPILPEKLGAEVPSIGIRNLSLPTRQGVWLRDLAAKGPVTVRVSGDPVTPYVYYLTPFEQGRIPSSLHYRFSRQQLGQTDLRLHGDPATVGWWVNNVSVSRHSFIGQGNSLTTPHAGATVREYVGPLSPDILHFRETGSFGLAGRNDVGDRSSTSEVFDRPFRRVEHRLSGLATPGPDTGPDFYGDTGAFFGNFQPMCMPCREGDTLFANTLGRSVNRGFGESNLSSGGLVRDFASGTEFHLYRDGVELPSVTAPGNFTTYTLPKEEGSYRLTADGQATHATWTFTSARQAEDTKAPGSQCVGRFLGLPGGACGPAPMVFVTYDLGDEIAMDNTLAAGGRHTFTVNAYHAGSTVKWAPIAGLRVWASTDDGAHWAPLRVRRAHDGTFTVTADIPAYDRTTGSLSLKAQAWDADGNSLSLTTLKAVALRPGHHATRAE